MAEEAIVADDKTVGTEQNTPEVKTTPTVEELIAQLKEKDQLLTEKDGIISKTKSDLVGTDKALSDKNKMLEEFRSQHETEKQRAEREKEEAKLLLAKQQNDLQAQKTEIEKMQNAYNIRLKADSLELTPAQQDLMTKMGVNTVEGVELYKQALDMKGESISKNILDSHSGKPEGYNNKTNNVDTSFLNGCKA